MQTRKQVKESINEWKVDFSISGKGLREVILANSATVEGMGPRQYSQKCFHLRGCCGIRQHC